MRCRLAPSDPEVLSAVGDHFVLIGKASDEQPTDSGERPSPSCYRTLKRELPTRSSRPSAPTRSLTS
jgi:hypothetical protein